MEDWKNVIVAYCGVAILWCLYTLFRYLKLQKRKDFSSMKKLFMAPNPVPVKAALAHKGLCEDFVRRPLVELNETQKAELFSVLDKFYED